jgi:hypothetical protein
MKADEYRVLQTAIEEGVMNGFLKIYPEDDDIFDHYKETAMVNAVMDSILEWFHIERSWIRESNV